MKKLFGFILIGIGILFQGVNGKQTINGNNQQVKINDSKKDSLEKMNLTPEQEQQEIQNRLKGLGYFQ